MATLFHGLLLEVSDDDGSTWTPVNGITGYDNPGSARAEIDVTNSQSAAKEFVLDIADNGTITFNANIELGDAGQDEVRAAQADGLVRKFRVTFVDATTLIYDGLVTGFSNSGSEGGVISGTISTRITGAVTGTAV